MTVVEGSPRPLGPAGALAAGVGLVVFGHAVARGLNPICSYAFGHWLLTWDHGFIKRGLVGTLLHPVLAGHSPADIRRVVDLLATVVFTAWCLVVLRLAAHVAAPAFAPASRRQAWFLAPVALALLASPAVVVGADTFGFFDHVLLLLTVGSVALVERRAYAAAALLAALGPLVHELYAVYGLPAVALAFALAVARDHADGAGTARPLAWVLIPLASVGLVVAGQAALPPERVAAVRAELTALNVLSATQVDNAVFHLDHGFADNLASRDGRVWRNLTNAEIARTAWPALVAMVAPAGVLLWRAPHGVGRRPWALPLLLVTALAPLVAHGFASDATRFTNLAVLQAAVALGIVLRLGRPALDEAPQRGARGLAWALAALAVASLAASWTSPVLLLTGHVDGHGLLAPR